jgi:phosphoglycerate dehydrogenase-like enzyme
LIAWVHDGPGREAMGPPPDGVEVAPFPDDPAAAPERAEVEFVIPDWLALRGGLEALPALRVVQTRSAGVDWIVDRVPAGVTLCSARGARDAAMAEWVLWAILADLKEARAAAEQQAARRWKYLDSLRDLHGARVLILGHGSIGEAVEARLVPFGVREVIRVARRARDGVHAVDDLARLLPGADVVVNLLPATPQTNGLFDAGMVAAMRDGALLVNAGRGATVDTDALVRALEDGRVRAVLDVVDPEPLPAEHPLWRAPNVIITPHCAGDTPGAERAAWALCGEQLRRYVAGEPLRNVVRDGY